MSAAENLSPSIHGPFCREASSKSNTCVALPHAAGQTLPIVGICALAQLLGVWMRRGGLDYAPLWVLKAIVTLGDVSRRNVLKTLGAKANAAPPGHGSVKCPSGLT